MYITSGGQVSQCPGSCHLYLKDAGALFQRNIGSLEGLYGEAVSTRCEALLAEEMYDVIGTDLHNERYADSFDGFGFNVSE